MIKLLIGLLAGSLSIGAFANTEVLLNTVAGSEEVCRLYTCKAGKEIVRALKIELAKAKVTCSGTLKGAIQNGSFLKAILESPSPILSYDQHRNIVSIASDTLVDAFNIYVLDFELSSDLKKINAVTGFLARNNTQSINSGTILNPQIETQVTEYKRYETLCSVL